MEHGYVVEQVLLVHVELGVGQVDTVWYWAVTVITSGAIAEGQAGHGVIVVSTSAAASVPASSKEHA